MGSQRSGTDSEVAGRWVLRPSLQQVRRQRARIDEDGLRTRTEAVSVRAAARAMARDARTTRRALGLTFPFHLGTRSSLHAEELTIGGRLRPADLAALRGALRDLRDAPLVLVDLSQCEYLTAAGVGVLRGARCAHRDAGGDLRVFEPSGQVRWMFEVLGAAEDGLLFSTEAAALGIPN